MFGSWVDMQWCNATKENGEIKFPRAKAFGKLRDAGMSEADALAQLAKETRTAKSKGT